MVVTAMDNWTYKSFTMPRALKSVSQMVERVLSEQLKTIGETVKSEATALGTLFQTDEATLAKERLMKDSRVCRCRR